MLGLARVLELLAYKKKHLNKPNIHSTLNHELSNSNNPHSPNNPDLYNPHSPHNPDIQPSPLCNHHKPNNPNIQAQQP